MSSPSGSRLDHLENLGSNAPGATLTIQRFEYSLSRFDKITSLGSSFGTGFMLGRIAEKLASLL
ncbi:hypothetical protein [Synechococcus sp. BA-124 BA4]|uniref:hypothetical protein n=1 Tax=Synechococcus sp. BA-124 BA4 TaxID=3110251 RepID=UPI002B1EE51B|nr:hypothetical protein [Synechococcus sp. BA-124 BA4]